MTPDGYELSFAIRDSSHSGLAAAMSLDDLAASVSASTGEFSLELKCGAPHCRHDGGEIQRKLIPLTLSRPRTGRAGMDDSKVLGGATAFKAGDCAGDTAR
ncbi:hypothetical protein [Sphingomonas aerophila]|uniref:Uncharacterized protein n=1 Tax=Sphingomonas aerophila TaxID=1344948 RepID=A0A7W9BAI5_9SPHN|nr:hypothetical protein [Sphingomonas aerophila]MBB5713642.1 hypothetical protein [Sphingomonas aerophila]